MQRDRRHPDPVQPVGPEAYLSPFLTAAARIAVIVALVWFVAVVVPMRDRIPLPRPAIPGAIIAAAGLALFMLWRAIASVRNGLRAWKDRNKPPQSDS